MIISNGQYHWCPPSQTGDWAADTKLGRDLADQFVTQNSPDVLPLALSRIALTIIEGGNCGPIETGFFSRIGDYVVEAISE